MSIPNFHNVNQSHTQKKLSSDFTNSANEKEDENLHSVDVAQQRDYYLEKLAKHTPNHKRRG